MDQELSVDQILGAFLGGEMSQEERAAIDRLFAQDPAYKAHADELFALIGSIKTESRPVSHEMRAALRKRVESLIANESVVSIDALVAASLSDDLSVTERTLVQKHFQSHPDALNEVKNFKRLTGIIKEKSVRVTPQMSQTLADRLRQKLPPGALKPLQNSTPFRAATNSTRKKPSDSASVRVYSVPEDIWSKRVRYAGVAAALGFLLLGAGYLAGKHSNQIAKDVLPDDHQDPKLRIARDNPILGPAEKSNPDGIIPPAPTNAPVARNQPQPEKKPGPLVEIPKIVVPIQNEKTKPPEVTEQTPNSVPLLPDPNQSPIPPNDRFAQGPRFSTFPPSIVPPAPPVTPANPSNPTNPPAAPTNPGGTPGPVSPVNTPVQSPPSNTPNNNPPVSTDDTLVASLDRAIVGTVRDGVAQVQYVAGGPVHQLHRRSEIPSGSEIVTSDSGRLALLMPGNGRLYIDKSTSLKLDFHAESTHITLNAGQISFHGAPTGLLQLDSHGVEVANARSVDTKIQGNSLIVSVLDKTATVGPRGKTVSVPKGSKAVSPLDQDTKPVKEPSQGPPDNWKNDLLLPGDTPDPNAVKSKRRSL